MSEQQQETAEFANTRRYDRGRHPANQKTFEARVTEVLSRLGIGLCLVTPEYRVAWSNPHHVLTHIWGEHETAPCYQQISGREPCSGCLVKEVFTNGQTLSQERYVRTHSGGQQLRLIFSPLYDPSQDIEYVMLTTVDMGRGQGLPVENEKMVGLGMLASGVARELDGIISDIAGRSREGQVRPEREDVTQDILREVARNSLRAKTILKQLLDHSNRHIEDDSRIGFDEVLDQAFKIVSRTLGRHEVEILRGPESGVMMECNPWQLRMLLMNVVFDVIDNVKPGTDIRVQTFDEDESGGERRSRPIGSVPIAGMRISYELSPSSRYARHDQAMCLFDKRSVETCSTRDLFHSACEVATQMGGWLKAERTDMRQTIELTIPIHVAPTENETDVEDDRSESIERVLIIDDEEVIRKLLVSVLSDNGYDVVAVDSASEGIDLARTDRFDLVVADVRMPGHVDGIDAMHEIKRTHPDCRVILISGQLPDKETEARIAEADGYIQKPFEFGDLLNCIRSMST